MQPGGEKQTGSGGRGQDQAGSTRPTPMEKVETETAVRAEELHQAMLNLVSCLRRQYLADFEQQYVMLAVRRAVYQERGITLGGQNLEPLMRQELPNGDFLKVRGAVHTDRPKRKRWVPVPKTAEAQQQRKEELKDERRRMEH